jgi:Rrf2 family protein
MKISKASDYGASMMLYIAKQARGRPVPVTEIANNISVSVKYLEQLLIPLKKTGYVKSVRGPKGGFLLAKDPKDITIADIVIVLETETDLVPCLANPAVCSLSGDCLTRGVWHHTSQAMFDALKSHTLSSLVEHN